MTNITGASTSATWNLGVAVAPDRTLLLLSGQGPAGQASGETASTTNNLGLSTAALDFAGPGGNQVLVTRAIGATSGVLSQFSGFAVQFVK